VLRRSYGFTLDDDGEVHGLVAGDMGYEPTGIKLCAETMKAISNPPAQPQLSDEEILRISADSGLPCFRAEHEVRSIRFARALLSRQSGEDKSADGGSGS
jgi:hypothetical protein